MSCVANIVRRGGYFRAKSISIKLLTSLFLPCSMAAFAQDASITAPPTKLPPIVVQPPANPSKKVRKFLRQTPPSGQQGVPAAGNSSDANSQTPVISPTTISTPVNQVPNSITVITAEQLQQDQRQTAPDALQAVPGLNVVQTGGPGGQTSVFMRGTNSNHVKVLVDGIEVSDPSVFDGSVDFAHLTTSDIARIEVLRGPQSGLYGSDAIGGVISIITKKGDGPPQAYASAEAGSFGTFSQAAGVSGSSQGVSYAFNIAHYRADDVPVTPSYLVPPGQSRIDNSYDNMTYSTKLGAEISKDLSVNFVARYVDSTYRFNALNFCFDPSCVKLGQEPEESTQINHQFWTRGEAVWSLFDGRFKNYFGLAYTDIWTGVTDPFNPSSNTTFEGERIKYDWRGVTEIAPGQVILTGVERKTENLNDFPGTHQTGDAAAFAELESEWAKRLFLNANIRYDDDDSFGGHTTWRVASAYIVPDTSTKLKASYGTGFKAPTLTELFVSFPAFNFFANPNLKPEESAGYDAGFEQPLLNDRIRFGATYFHNDLTNLITSGVIVDSTGNPVNTSVNIGRAETYGLESFASFAITPTLNLRADYTYTIARDELTGDELLRRPKNKVSVTSSWKAMDDLTLSATINHVSSWKENFVGNNFEPGFRAPGFTTVNLAANYKASDRITLFGRIDNLFNVKYEDPAGFLRPGFGVFAGVRVDTSVADLIEPRK
jgi:vitamin B12 transporter